MNKFFYLIGHYIKKKIFTKQFLWANVFILLFLILLFNIDTIISSMDKDTNNSINLIIKDNIGVTDIIESETKSVDKDKVSINIKSSDLDVEEIKKSINNKEDILIVINESDNYFDVEIISYDNIEDYYNTLETILYNTKIKYALKTYNISIDELNKIERDVSINQIILKESARNSKRIDIMLGITAAIFMLPSLMLIIYLVQMIGTSINQEKSSHSMEIILSNVSAKSHFWAQIISSNLFIIIQSILMSIYGVISLVIRFMFNTKSNISTITNTMNIDPSSINVDSNMVGEFINRIPSIILVIVIMTLLSFVAYSILAAILSSMTTSIEDFNNIEAPIMLLVFGGFYIALIAGLYPESTLIKVLSIIPFLSFVISPTLYALGSISIYYVMGSIIALLIIIFILIKYGINVYREGLLNYEGTMVWKRLFKVLKKK